MRATNLGIATLLAALVIGWIATGEGYRQRAADPNPASGEKPRPHDAGTLPARINVQVATSEATEYRGQVVVRGRTQPSRRVSMRALVKGRVIELPLPKGARIETGAIVARLDLAEKPSLLREAEAEVAQARLEEAAADALSERGYRAEANVAAARAASQRALANRDRIQLAIANATIRAPFAGVLNERSVEHGDYVMEGQPIGVVTDLDPIVVAGHVSQAERARIEAGASAEVRAPDNSRWKGRVRYLSSEADRATGTFALEVEVANPDYRLVAGLSAEVRIGVQPAQAHLIASSVLSVDESGQLGVKTVDSDDRVAFNPVRVLGTSGARVWVTGLPARARIIVVGGEFVEAGGTVSSHDAGPMRIYQAS